MKRLNILILSILAATLYFSPAAVKARECRGNACDDITYTLENGCFVIRNHSTRRVTVKLGGYTLKLQRGEETKLLWIDGKTCTGIVGGDSMTANYTNSGGASVGETNDSSRPRQSPRIPSKPPLREPEPLPVSASLTMISDPENCDCMTRRHVLTGTGPMQTVYLSRTVKDFSGVQVSGGLEKHTVGRGLRVLLACKVQQDADKGCGGIISYKINSGPPQRTPERLVRNSSQPMTQSDAAASSSTRGDKRAQCYVLWMENAIDAVSTHCEASCSFDEAVAVTRGQCYANTAREVDECIQVEARKFHRSCQTLCEYHRCYE